MQPIQAVDFTTIRLDPKTQKDLAPNMVSWRTVYLFMRDMDDSVENLHKLSNVLALELANPEGPRHQILMRLHGRINSMRQRLECSEIMMLARR